MQFQTFLAVPASLLIQRHIDIELFLGLNKKPNMNSHKVS